MVTARRVAPPSITDVRRRARRRLPGILFDYIEGGADAEWTVRDNEEAFARLQLEPRVGVDVGQPECGTTVLGCAVDLPVLLAPCGFVQLVHRDGAAGVARAAQAAGTVAVLSKIALAAPEDVAASTAGPHWFQVNLAGGRQEVERLMVRAAAAGFTGLVVTMDGPPPGNHERDARNGMVPPVRPTAPLLARVAGQLVTHPRWAAGVVPVALRLRGARESAASGASRVLASPDLHRYRATWADVEWIRQRWAGHLLVKGVLRAEDAALAVDAGADAVIVSNHGGRQLDGVPATVAALPAVADAVGDRVEVLVDGGVRRATDVAKALCLGARAVLVGRPYLYGLACGGQGGVEQVLQALRAELVRTLRLMGCPSVTALDRSWLAADAARNLVPAGVEP